MDSVATHEGGIVDRSREGHVLYIDREGRHYTSAELIRAYHPDGEAVVAYAHGGWRGKQPYAPGFERELNHAVWLSGATRHAPLHDDEDE